MNINSALQQASPLAPPGLRNLWNSGTVSGSFVWYFEAPNLLYTANAIASTNYVSSDGGITYSPLIFSSPPTRCVAVGYNGSLYIGLSKDAGDYNYTSTDGVHFTNVGTLPYVLISYNIIWFNNLFIAGVGVSPTQSIMTSPDGITWTAQNTPNVGLLFDLTTLTTDGSIVVMACNSSQNPILWSSDGVTWQTATGGPSSHAGAITYNYDENRNEWILFNQSTNDAYRSFDGIRWSNLGTWTPLSGTSCFWVSKYSRYFLTGSNNGVYTMLSSEIANGRTFFNCDIDGAGASTTGYNMGLYIPQYDRFIIGTSESGVGYTTSRLYDIKSAYDNIRVFNSPVRVSKYSTYGTVN